MISDDNYELSTPQHEFWLRNSKAFTVKAKHVSEKNIFCSMNKDKIGEERIYEILRAKLNCNTKVSRMDQASGASTMGPFKLSSNQLIPKLGMSIQ